MSTDSICELNSSEPWRALGQVLESYLALKEQAVQLLSQETGSFLDAWLSAKAKLAEKNRTTGSDFNPLASIPIKEPVHSKIIGDLLNVEGSHGQGSLFLMCFLDMLDVPNGEAGTWKVSIEKERVDIMLWRESPAAMILIENKVKDAQDQLNQLYRYWHHQMYSWKPEHCSDDEMSRSFRLIYLPADDSKTPAAHSLERPADWGNAINPHLVVPLKCETLALTGLLQRWQENVVKGIPASNHRLRVFFQLYQELWSRP